ncbi:hypothetical protein [Streptomyces pratensis]|uniref:hypothetical protein n=1 Tax=Streptomyces pratensis TaxID=1169025 RepID=UPI003633B399
MPIGPEVTALTRVAGTVVQGVSERATGSPPWPNLHESLIELHEIINDWCEASTRTNRALQQIGTNAQTRRELRGYGDPGSNGADYSITIVTLRLGRGYVEKAHREINSIMQPAAPLMLRWSSYRRRQAGRRSLRNLMTIYCPELLSMFELAVKARTEWVAKYREFIDGALRSGEVSPDSLSSLRAETAETTAALVAARDSLQQLIKDQYPMGYTHGGQ